MSCSDEYAPQLRARGYRMTSQRLSIMHVLHHESGHLSPGEVHKLAQDQLPSLTETTVYRTLEFLAENGLVRPAHMGGGHLVYEIARHDHHHLKCQKCGGELEIDLLDHVDVVEVVEAHLK